jgi:hypothetical protein
VGGLAEAIATTPGAAYTSEHPPTAECPLDLVDGAARYGLGMAIKVLLADDAALERLRICARHNVTAQHHRGAASANRSLCCRRNCGSDCGGWPVKCSNASVM